ncbi:hypothetical protein ACQP2U_43745 (plasmid) [Nocardia sp. CA-084685]|uniref:hypothetical protein n=1 Tax=Nocardia sp. CA-084685 TaxID=3239970 RepID=UPI003D992DE7
MTGINSNTGAEHPDRPVRVRARRRTRRAQRRADRPGLRSSVLRRAASLAELTDRYQPEMTFLREQGLDSEIVWHDGCSGLRARVDDGHYLHATNGDHCLIGRVEENSNAVAGPWYVGIYTLEGDAERITEEQVAEGIATEFAAAFHAARASQRQHLSR